MGNTAGVDWASEKHDVLVVDETGERLVHRPVKHDEAGIEELLDLLVRYRVDRVGIERPDGILVERMLDRGITVVAMHPNQVAAARPRFRPAGGKSDSFDAYVLAELARTDMHRFRVLCPDSDETRALRALTRGREDLVGARVALTNQLKAELDRFWPGAACLFSDLHSPIALAFLQRYPSPTDATGLGEKRLAQFLARHQYCGRKPAGELLTRLRTAPTGRAGELEQDARRHLVLALVAAIKPLVNRIRELTSEIAHAVRVHPDGPIFLSFFRDPKSVITAATLLAEIGDDRSRYAKADNLAADNGMSPVAVESGKSRHAVFRRACDHRLRTATCTLADSTRHWHPWAQAHYANARARGHDHPRAIRTVGRAWTRVIWACWQTRTPYDPALHGALKTMGG